MYSFTTSYTMASYYLNLIVFFVCLSILVHYFNVIVNSLRCVICCTDHLLSSNLLVVLTREFWDIGTS